MPKPMLLLTGLAALAVAGCEGDPLYRPGTWRPTGVNDANLAAMLANPYDGQVGESAATSRGNGASRAATRLYTDQRRPLLNSTVGQVGSTAAPTADAPMNQGSGGGGAGH